MKVSCTRLLSVLVAVLLAAAISPTAFAQKAALTKSVDEPGRQPYEVIMRFNTSGGGRCDVGCTNYISLGSLVLFDAPPVPAGKRLVIQWVSAALPTGNSSSLVALQASRVASPQAMKWMYAGPFFQFAPPAGVFGMSSAAFTTYGPGETPHILLLFDEQNSTDGNMTISGYLIDATN